MLGFPLDSRVTYVTDPDTGVITPKYDRAVTSKPLKEYIRGIITTGVLPNPSDNLQVFPGTDGMTVIVHAGFAVIDGGLAKEDNNRTLEVTASDATYDRIDTVVVRWNDNDSVRNVDLYIKQGVPARNPVRPTLTREGSVYEIGLADIFVTKNVRTITAEKITDTRMESARCGIVSSVSKWDTTTIYQQIQSDLAGFKSNEQAEFMTWFDKMKDQLTEDAAGKLQTEVDDVRGQVDGVRGQIRTNLLNHTAQTQTKNGVTFTNNGDGTYTVNGTASENATFFAAERNIPTEIKGKRLRVLGCPSGGSQSTYRTILYIKNGDTILSQTNDIGNGIELNVPQEATDFVYIIQITDGVTVSNLLFKPMLTTDLNAKYDDFVPYTGDSGRLNEDVANLIKGISTDHNSVYQKKDITEWYESGELWERIEDDFKGIYPGQYFDCGKTITASGSSETGTSIILIAGCNVHLNTNSGMRYNHITCVPVTHFGTAHMNPSNTTEGAYLGSEMSKSIIGGVATSGGGSTINSQLFGVFGSHLKTSTELLSNSINAKGYNRFGINSGCSNDWGWRPVQAVLMSEIEVYGSTVWSSSGFDTGSAKVQMPAFRYNTNDMIPDGVYYYLKDVASSTHFCLVAEKGNADRHGASSVYYVRPRFILGK